ncbi:MAG: hypothetical protein LBE78_10150 [Burkholderiaceae bacterium]|jgi:hypothetical protein|nr:hypothetical protein [Burkholderiaceae bacterium]
MTQTYIRLGGLEIAVTFKTARNVHLSVHPPQGKVTLVAPTFISAGSALCCIRPFLP